MTKLKFSFKNDKHVETFLQIFVLMLATFAVSYLIHETNPKVIEMNDKKGHHIKEIVSKIVSGLNLIPSVAAVTSHNSTSSTSVNEQCCLKDNKGAICQSYSSNIIADACSANQIFPGKCQDTAQCQIGTCIDPDEGTCSLKSTKGACEQSGGKWNSDPNGNIAECKKGCCVLGENVQFTTETRCNKLSTVFGTRNQSGDNFRQVGNELECLALAPNLAASSGACVFEDKSCKFSTLQDCAVLSGTFSSGVLCSASELETICKKQDHVDCLDGKDEIYWFDSCGNRENIYSANKDASFNNGKVLTKEQSCNVNSSNADSQTCGNCNYLLGSKCSEVKAGGTKVNDGNFICSDLSCDSSKETGGVKKENGESWCAYDSYIGDGKDTVGSRHWKRVCIDGKVQVEPCADFRGELCTQSDVDVGNGKKLSNAACTINQGLECVRYNQQKDSMEKNCKENPQCQLTEVNVDKGFKFSICTAKYPGGFDLTGESESRATQSASQLCATANQKCTVIYVKKLFSGYVCTANCACETKKFSEEMNNLCIALGDCGSYINYAGQGTDNINVKGAPKVSWQQYTKYAKPVAGQNVESENISSLVKRLGLGVGGSEEEAASTLMRFMGSALGATGTALQIGSYMAIGFSFKGSLVSFVKGGGGAGTTLGAWGNAFGAAGLSFSVGMIVGKLLGLDQQSSMIAATAGAVVGFIVGFKIGFLGGVIWGIIIAVVLAIIFKLLGVGKIKKVIVKFECLPWQPPAGGAKCEECNKDPLKPCTQYRCSALGKSCELINTDSENPVCVYNGADDHAPPKISPLNISEGFAFENSNANDVQVRTTNSACIPAFTQVAFSLRTDERAQCKYDFERKSSYDELENYPLENTYYTKEHNFGVVAPSLESLQSLGAEITGDARERLAKLDMNVRCQDVNGNTNTVDYVVDFCIASGPDQTAPRIVATDPLNDASLKQDTLEQNLTVYLNEPAECKYDVAAGKNYSGMINTMDCNTDLNDPGNLGWQCDTLLTGLKNEDNTFYIKCRDQPWLNNTENESKRNTNNEDYVYILHGTNVSLKIDYTKPTGEIVDGVEPRTVPLEIGTSGGIDNGNAICTFGFVDYDSADIPFFDTGGSVHKQNGMQFLSGEQFIYVKCQDDAENIALGNITFSLRLDEQAPIAVRLFSEGNRLKLITDEDAECYYELNKPLCDYNVKNATSMTTAFSKEHSADWQEGRTLDIKCLDVFGNEPTVCTVKASPTDII